LEDVIGIHAGLLSMFLIRVFCHFTKPAMIDSKLQRPAWLALLAAALFGASAPLSKLLLTGLGPFTLAALLYLGSGFGLLVFTLVPQDWPWLVGAIACGGVAAPVLLLWGLSGTSGSEASLLLSTEGLLTVLVSALAFKEHVGRRVWLGAGLMLVASVLLMREPGGGFGFSLRAAAVIGACALWALDNNLTRPLSGRNPATIAMTKGLLAGSVNLGLAWLLGEAMPTATHAALAMVLGSLAYGASLFLYILALRHLGSARAAAHFGTAPFIGAVLSVILLSEPITLTLTVACVLMLWATWLTLSERHDHAHSHRVMVHAHRHVHDEHHHHAHGPDDGPEPHAHPHRHEPLTHDHAHLPDLHHRHGHS
jgi:drug/metabolite transporter (DMT)-like permease